MPQHFIKSAAIRDISIFKVSLLSEDEAFWFFVEARYQSTTHVVCPHCGVVGKHYFRGMKRKQWRCKDCFGYFSVTRGTPFEDHKMPFKKLLLGIVAYVTHANGISLHTLAQQMDVQIKTAQAFVGKLREALFRDQPDDIKLSGTIHIDGGYFGGRPRSGRVRRRIDEKEKARLIEQKLAAPKEKNRVPLTAAARRNYYRRKKRRVVMVLRELYPTPGLGGKRTITVICNSENDADAVSLARRFIEPGSTIMTDENGAYNRFSAWFQHKTVEHSVEYATEDGVSDNQAESYYSRLRRYVLGVAHRIEPKYLADIAVEFGWREDVRRQTNGDKTALLLKAAFNHGRSRWWRGYWQGWKRTNEILWNATSATTTH